MDERLYCTLLYDFYGGLLTEKQREMFEGYYCNDLSLREIGEPVGVSRQAVSDLLKRTKNLLLDYEARLALVARHTALSAGVEKLEAHLRGLHGDCPDGNWNDIEADLCEIKDLL